MTTPPDQPTWQTDPDALDRLCQLGAAILHGGPPPDPRDTVTIQPIGEYL